MSDVPPIVSLDSGYNKKHLIIELTLVFLVLAGILVWWQNSRYFQNDVAFDINRSEADEANSLGTEISSKIINPGNSIPEANPFEADINPLKNIYENPFK